MVSGSAKNSLEVNSVLQGLQGSQERLMAPSESLRVLQINPPWIFAGDSREVEMPDWGSQMSIGEEIGAGDDFLEEAAVPRRAVKRDDDNAASREASVSAKQEST